ncbi:hypothetical protein JTE90_017462 [Oedothorax gibbosus]|uniref:Uncharacterized protein n=1 Tax=Oedothorax gibbosus TaxID=931172 RepID=A0AAV6U3M3_9ARAC|nr:hypothetical protein JTE90_017462 [Oedothorax gibbosus]
MVSLKHPIFRIISIFVLLFGTPIRCGFTDSINTHSVDHVISSIKTPQIGDNTTLMANAKKEQRQGFYPAGNQFSSALASMAHLGSFGNMASMGGLRTVMMGGMLYGLSLIPAVVLALGGSGLPLGGMLSTLGLSKRALHSETSSAKLPLLTENQTRRLLQMLQSAFRQWNIADEHCKQLFVCQMYRQVSSNGVTPDLDLFKEALLHILERGGQRRAGRAAEHLLAEYEHYFHAARMGMAQDSCEANFPKCDLSLYPKDDGFKPTNNNKKKAPKKPTRKEPMRGDAGLEPNSKKTLV